MPTRVTSKGQVTIPKPVRELLGIKPGSVVDFRRASDGSIVIEKADHRAIKRPLDEVRGIAGRGMTTDEIMALTRGE